MATTTRPTLPASIALLNRSKKVTSSNGGWRCQCPSHASEGLTLSIREEHGKVLIHCFAGCTPEEVLAAVNLTISDAFAPDQNRERLADNRDRHMRRPGVRPEPQQKPAPKPEPEPRAPDIALGEPYISGVYRMPDGTVYHHWRQDTRRADGKADKRVWWEPRGCHPDQLPLYRVRRLLSSDPIYIVAVCEGEKATDALAKIAEPLFHVAVGTACGASTIPCDLSLEPLLGREVVLWPDNDDVGRQHMDKIAQWLVDNGNAPPLIVRWADAPPKGDAADAVQRGANIADLLTDAKPWVPPAPTGRGGGCPVPEGLTGVIWQ